MKLAHVIACVFWISLGVALSMGGLGLGLGAPSDPGSGFLPFWTGILISLLGIMQLGTLCFWKSRDDSQTSTRAAIEWKRPACFVVILTLYGLFMPYLGYLVATFFALLGLFSIYDRRRWGWVSVGSLIVTIATFVVFHELLRVQLPAGILRFGG
jgi:putative tricarboxylic transport membrane protein